MALLHCEFRHIQNLFPSILLLLQPFLPTRSRWTFHPLIDISFQEAGLKDAQHWWYRMLRTINTAPITIKTRARNQVLDLLMRAKTSKRTPKTSARIPEKKSPVFILFHLKEQIKKTINYLREFESALKLVWISANSTDASKGRLPQTASICRLSLNHIKRGATLCFLLHQHLLASSSLKNSKI